MELPCGTFNQNYSQDIAVIRTKSHWGFTIFGLVLLFCLPLFLPTSYVHILNYTFIWVIAALGLQLAMGYTGLISFAQAALMAVGAYSSAIFTTKLGIPFVPSMLLSGLTAGLIGLIGGAPSMRIKGFYLALATLAMHYIIYWFVLHSEVTGGIYGLRVPNASIGWLEFKTTGQMFYLIGGIMVLMTFFAKNLTRCKVGRAFVAIRDNDLSAAVMGINVFRYKLLAFFIASFYAGIAGSLWAHLWNYVHPEQFGVLMAFFFVGMLIVGGLGSIAGVFFGVFLIRGVEEGLTFAAPSIAAAFPSIGMHPAASLAASTFGLIMVLFLLFMPKGLAHSWEILKISYRRFPFTY